MTKRKPGNKKIGVLEKCPHPECDHIGLLITKVHCRMHHNMERDELFKKYGFPLPVEIDPTLRKKNSEIKTIYLNNGSQHIPGQSQGMR